MTEEHDNFYSDFMNEITRIKLENNSLKSENEQLKKEIHRIPECDNGAIIQALEEFLINTDNLERADKDYKGHAVFDFYRKIGGTKGRK